MADKVAVNLYIRRVYATYEDEDVIGDADLMFHKSKSLKMSLVYLMNDKDRLEWLALNNKLPYPEIEPPEKVRIEWGDELDIYLG